MKITFTAESFEEMRLVCEDFLKGNSSIVSKKPVKQEKQALKNYNLGAQVRAKLTALMQSGKADIVYRLLSKYGADTISELSEEYYGEIFSEIDQ